MKSLLIGVVLVMVGISSVAHAQSQVSFIITDLASKELDLVHGVRGSIDGIIVKARPEDRYRVKAMHVALVRGTKQIKTLETTSGEAKFTSWQSEFLAGDRIVISITSLIHIREGKEGGATSAGQVLSIPIQ